MIKHFLVIIKLFKIIFFLNSRWGLCDSFWIYSSSSHDQANPRDNKMI